MKKVITQCFMFALALGIMAFTTSPVHAAKAKTEDELIATLSDTNEDKVAEALLQIEKQFPTSTKAFPTIKKLLTDPREKVRRKAARVLGALHAEVDATDLKNICAMLKSTSSHEAMDALKSLRGLKAQSVMPEIVAQLKDRHAGVVRDACRTVAELGNRSNIPDLEPLLNHPDSKVQKDAKDAIFRLNARL